MKFYIIFVKILYKILLFLQKVDPGFPRSSFFFEDLFLNLLFQSLSKSEERKNKEKDSKFRHNCSPKLPQLQARQLTPPPPTAIRPGSASTPVRVPVPPSQK